MIKQCQKVLAAMLAAGMCFGAAGAESVLTGERVLQLEQQLYALGYHGESCDSQLDEGTRRALRSFQTANGLTQTGEPDSATLEALGSGMATTCHDYLVNLKNEYAAQPILQSGSSGDAVLWMQKTLKELGYFSGVCDGVFGEATQLAVQRFQMANGLTETGMADHSTQLRLYEGEPMKWERFLESAAAAAGDNGVHVRRMQRELRDMGYFKGECTGEYGELTQLAVNLFQMTNELEVSGAADAATCDVLYSGKALPLMAEETLNSGDASQEVTMLQSRLGELGYYRKEASGVYGATTETAVRLFQMANNLPSTGAADAATMACVYHDGAVGMEQAREAFGQQLNMQDGVAKAVVGNVASRMRGQRFVSGEEDLFEGFAFVQYVCVAAGIPVVSPEDLVERIAAPVTDFAELSAGELIAFRMDDGDGVHMMLAVCMGEERIVYATQDSEWVLECRLDRMHQNEIYRWDMGTYGE